MTITLTVEELTNHASNVDLFYRQAMLKLVNRLKDYVDVNEIKAFKNEKDAAFAEYVKDTKCPPKIVAI